MVTNRPCERRKPRSAVPSEIPAISPALLMLNAFVLDAPGTSMGDEATLSEKKAVECGPVTGEGTDDVAAVVDPKRDGLERTGNSDACQLTP
jgi:hypothetical protein